MQPEEIAKLRLSAQHIAQADFKNAHDVVAWMGAMQAQDYPGALWSLALRTHGLTMRGVEEAITNRKIVRTWPMRGTLHFLAAEDVRWITSLLAPRAVAAAAGRRHQLELDDAVMEKSKAIIIEALAGNQPKTRTELCQLLDDKGIITADQRGLHILHYLAETGLLCFGPHEGKQPTFVLLDEWLSPTPEKEHDEALRDLARRFFASHGPATLQDFAGWGFMKISDAKLGLELARPRLVRIESNGVDYWMARDLQPAQNATFLLPGFDEYMLGYKNRSAALHELHANKIVPGNNGMFLPMLVIDGQVVGTWKRATRATSQQLTIVPFEPLSKAEIATIAPAIKRYEQYCGLPTFWKLG
jgi:hypothetical protein